MSQPLYVQLAQLESSLFQRKLSRAEYEKAKLAIIQEAWERKEILDPVFKDAQPREKQDSNRRTFHYLPPGPFLCGSKAEPFAQKAGIYIGKFPVTVKDFLDFVRDANWIYSKEEIVKMRKRSPTEDCPVSNVSWDDAKEYCRWLRTKTNEYYSLPHEKEWEYAARGIDGRPYPWGYEEPNRDLAWCSDTCTSNQTLPINSIRGNRSPFGCKDMAGNIAEWCLDEIGAENHSRILRGGSWYHPASAIDCVTSVLTISARERIRYAGFRLVYLPGDMYDKYAKHSI